MRDISTNLIMHPCFHSEMLDDVTIQVKAKPVYFGTPSSTLSQSKQQGARTRSNQTDPMVVDGAPTSGVRVLTFTGRLDVADGVQEFHVFASAFPSVGAGNANLEPLFRIPATDKQDSTVVKSFQTWLGTSKYDRNQVRVVLHAFTCLISQKVLRDVFPNATFVIPRRLLLGRFKSGYENSPVERVLNRNELPGADDWSRLESLFLADDQPNGLAIAYFALVLNGPGAPLKKTFGVSDVRLVSEGDDNDEVVLQTPASVCGLSPTAPIDPDASVLLRAVLNDCAVATV
jgi:hypothetical protein